MIEFDVTMQAEPMTLKAEFGEIYDISGGEAERLWQEGYIAGKTDGTAEGEAAGYAAGYTAGEKEGYTSGYAKGQETEQASTKAIISRETLKLYQNDVVTSVGSYAFYKWTGIARIVFTKAVQVGADAFYGCTNLNRADFHSLSAIQAEAFYGCTRLGALILRSSARCALTNLNAFTSTPIASGTGYIYVPDDLVERYKAATNWSTYAAQIKPLSKLGG